MKTIVILGKDKRQIDYVRSLLEIDGCIAKPFCFSGWQIEYEDSEACLKALEGGYDRLCLAHPELMQSVYLSLQENSFIFESVRAEIVNGEEI